LKQNSLAELARRVALYFRREGEPRISKFTARLSIMRFVFWVYPLQENTMNLLL